MSEIFLVISELKDNTLIERERLLELIEKEWETLIEYEKAGKVLAGGAMAGRRGGCGIWKAESITELHNMLSRLPLFFFTDTQITPLTSVEYALELTRHTLSTIHHEPVMSM